MSDDKHDRRYEDEGEATVLSAREAMSLISPSRAGDDFESGEEDLTSEERGDSASSES